MAKNYSKMETKGYWSALGGLELKDILYGIEDYALVVSGTWVGKPKSHKLKIYYGHRPYIKLNGYVFPFDECLRV